MKCARDRPRTSIVSAVEEEVKGDFGNFFVRDGFDDFCGDIVVIEPLHYRLDDCIFHALRRRDLLPAQGRCQGWRREAPPPGGLGLDNRALQ